jgi:hypothetical protein
MLIVEIMQTRWGVVVMLALSGCGSGGASGTEKQVCDHAAKLCDALDDVKECYSDLAETKKVMGKEYDKFLSCAGAAKTCGEYVGCAIGGLGNQALDQLDGVGKGMKKMLKDELGDLPGLDDIKERVKKEVREELGGEDALPAACRRIETVCSKDQPFIRRECKKLVENLGVDKTRIAELSACIDASENCFALEKCVDHMEDKMRGF